MKMAEKIEEIMFAPCGMNCKVCYKHCAVRKTGRSCSGCLASDETGKPGHCRKCKIKDCIREKGVAYCYECGQFPCRAIQNLEKSYRRRYHAGLIANSLFVKEHGLVEFMNHQRKVYMCPMCGGVFSLHDRICTECGQPLSQKKSNL